MQSYQPCILNHESILRESGIGRIISELQDWHANSVSIITEAAFRLAAYLVYETNPHIEGNGRVHLYTKLAQAHLARCMRKHGGVRKKMAEEMVSNFSQIIRRDALRLTRGPSPFDLAKHGNPVHQSFEAAKQEKPVLAHFRLF